MRMELVSQPRGSVQYPPMYQTGTLPAEAHVFLFKSLGVISVCGMQAVH